MATEEPASNLLMVEGPDDKHVVQHLRVKLAPELSFHPLVSEGYTNLLKAVFSEVRSSGRLALGILMDANDDISARWQAVGARLRKADVTVPEAPSPEGTIITGQPDLPRVGIWLMPDNKQNGELENFVARLVPKGDPVWPLAVRFVDGIPHEHREFPSQKEVRAKLHAWLATQRRPGPMGTAIGAGSLNATAPVAIQLVDWLKRLFGPSA